MKSLSNFGVSGGPVRSPHRGSGKHGQTYPAGGWAACILLRCLQTETRPLPRPLPPSNENRWNGSIISPCLLCGNSANCFLRKTMHSDAFDVIPFEVCFTAQEIRFWLTCRRRTSKKIGRSWGQGRLETCTRVSDCSGRLLESCSPLRQARTWASMWRSKRFSRPRNTTFPNTLNVNGD